LSVVDSVDAGAVGSRVDDWVLQKKVWAVEPDPGDTRSDVLDFGTAAAVVGGAYCIDIQDQETLLVQVACQLLASSPRGRVVVKLQAKLWGCAARYCSRQSQPLSLSNPTACERGTIKECPVMDHHMWYSNGHRYVDERQEAHRN